MHYRMCQVLYDQLHYIGNRVGRIANITDWNVDETWKTPNIGKMLQTATKVKFLDVFCILLQGLLIKISNMEINGTNKIVISFNWR